MNPFCATSRHLGQKMLPDMALYGPYCLLSFFIPKCTICMIIHIQSMKKHMQGLIFRPTQNHARLPGYGVLASVKRKTCQKMLHAISKHIWVLWGGEPSKFMACIPGVTASSLSNSAVVPKHLSSLSSPWQARGLGGGSKREVSEAVGSPWEKKAWN